MGLRTGNCSLHSDAKIVPATSSPLYVHVFGLARRAECLIRTALRQRILEGSNLSSTVEHANPPNARASASAPSAVEIYISAWKDSATGENLRRPIGCLE